MSELMTKGNLLPLTGKKLPVTHPGYQPPGSYNGPAFKPSSGLERYVRQHILRHFVETLAVLRPARFGVVVGHPGEGKTDTIRVVCSRLGVGLIVISPGALAGEMEGRPGQAIKELAEAVAAISAREQVAMAVLFDDIDTSNAIRRPGTEYTVNSQLAEGELQHMADAGTVRDWCGRPVPVFMTGNDLSGARAPLLRPGRATWFTHEPTLEERAVVVSEMFGMTERDARALVKAHASRPIAFFRGVAAELADAALEAAYQKYGFDLEAIGHALDIREVSLDVGRIRALADEAAKAQSGASISYLGRGRFS